MLYKLIFSGLISRIGSRQIQIGLFFRLLVKFNALLEYYYGTNLNTINTNLHIQLEGKEKLIIDYLVEHNDTIYDICDLDGRICISGRLNSGGNHEIDLSKLNSGRYQLYIIDEGDIKREMINLN